MTTHPLDRLYEVIVARKSADPGTSYTAKLLGKGKLKCAKKMGEEALETALAAVAEADLHFRGYPREYSPDGRQPNLYDYSNLDRTACWKLMEGDYTRFGRVDELLDEPDDRFVIMGPGDEVTLRFPADAFGPVRDGYRRSFLLKTDSFCKGMNLMAAHPDQVEPLPFHAMSGYPYGEDERYPDTAATREYRRRY
ncbi:MAG: phosphoribosyl-ATP diphosphatase, partial [Proteobacteria bacterium]|nr:phosphoribosyl-ATP diphosphatase [Pseudomonadota bacterium]